MYKDSQFAFYEKLYYHEFEMKQKIELKLQALLIFSFAWLNLTFSMTHVIDSTTNPNMAYLYYACVGLYFLTIGGSLVHSVSAYFGHTFSAIATPEVINGYYENLKVHYSKNSQKGEEAEIEVSRFVKENLITTTTHNSHLNAIRYEKSYRATKWMIFSGVPFIFSCIIFLICRLDLTHPSKPVLIEEKNLSSFHSYLKSINTEGGDQSVLSENIDKTAKESEKKLSPHNDTALKGK